MPEYKQDMPPKGGYSSVDWKMKFYNKKLSGWAMFGISIGAMIGGNLLELFWLKDKKKLRRLNEEANIAAFPFYLAEWHRATLLTMKVNYDEEKELMKDVPGWTVGSLYGEPIYHTRKNKLPQMRELMAHTYVGAFKKRRDENITR